MPDQRLDGTSRKVNLRTRAMLLMVLLLMLEQGRGRGMAKWSVRPRP